MDSLSKSAGATPLTLSMLPPWSVPVTYTLYSPAVVSSTSNSYSLAVPVGLPVPEALFAPVLSLHGSVAAASSPADSRQ